MTKYTLQDFVDFVNDQDSIDFIDHDGGWETCAVGEAARDAGVPLEVVEETLFQQAPNLRHVLNEPEGYDELPTYGDLQDWIREEV